MNLKHLSSHYSSVALIIIFSSLFNLYSADVNKSLPTAPVQSSLAIKAPSFCGYRILCCGCYCYCCKCCAECKASLAVNKMSEKDRRFIARRNTATLVHAIGNNGTLQTVLCARDMARLQTGITATDAKNAEEIELSKIDAVMAADKATSETRKSTSSSSNSSLPQPSPPSVPMMARNSASTNSQLPNTI